MTIIRRELRRWLAGAQRGQGAAWLTDSLAASQGWFRLPSTQAHLSPEMELPDTLALSKSSCWKNITRRHNWSCLRGGQWR